MRIGTVLVVDDDDLTLAAWRRSHAGQTILTARCAKDALELARSSRVDLAVVDMCLGCESGIDVIRTLHAEQPELVLVLSSAYMSIPVTVDAIQAGARYAFQKPITLREILHRLDGPSSTTPTDEIPSLARVEWEYISRVLADCGGNVSMAARRLGIYRTSLQRKLRKAVPRH